MDDLKLGGDMPVFEVTASTGHKYRIWADGRTFGFEPGHAILNNLPMLLRNMRDEIALSRAERAGEEVEVG
jgi:hypothetical protein